MSRKTTTKTAICPKYASNMPQRDLLSMPNMAIIWVTVGEMSEVFVVSAKRDNFIRLAEGRVTRAIDAIRVIGNLSNRSNYEYSEEDSKRIIDALQSEINALKTQFKPRPSSKKGFKLQR